jgi:hypothetical protein
MPGLHKRLQIRAQVPAARLCYSIGWSELSVHCRILAETVIVNYGCGLAVILCSYNCTSEVYTYVVSVVDVVLRVGECGLLVR